ncbi:MAG TPA: hypothetical protein VJ023_10190 [Pyrinomonadaceae bacterium]|nr:hypothetical protein [Pyrinomonadaceae bacterium]
MHRSNIRRALMGSELAHDAKRIYPRNLEIPAGGGVGTARAIARAYSVFATGGKELGLRSETLQELSAPAIPSTHGFYDECMKSEVEFSLGFMKTNPGFPSAIPARSACPERVVRLASPTRKHKLATDTFLSVRAWHWEAIRGMWRSERRCIRQRPQREIVRKRLKRFSYTTPTFYPVLLPDGRH